MEIKKFWISYLFATIFASTTAAAGDAMEGPLKVLIYDRSHVGSKILKQAEQLTGEIFASAGIEMMWTTMPVSGRDARWHDFSPINEQGCARPTDSPVTVEILPRAPNGFSAQALGYALPCARRGMQVILYTDRVETISHSSVAAFHRVLGHAMAHEIGHVLLQSSAHENSGLMKGMWVKGDWQRAAVAAIPLNAAQARQVWRGRLARRTCCNMVDAPSLR